MKPPVEGGRVRSACGHGDGTILRVLADELWCIVRWDTGNIEVYTFDERELVLLERQWDEAMRSSAWKN